MISNFTSHFTLKQHSSISKILVVLFLLLNCLVLPLSLHASPKVLPSLHLHVIFVNAYLLTIACFQTMLYASHDSGARISVGDGTLTIVAKNQAVMDKVQEKVFCCFPYFNWHILFFYLVEDSCRDQTHILFLFLSMLIVVKLFKFINFSSINQIVFL